MSAPEGIAAFRKTSLALVAAAFMAVAFFFAAGPAEADTAAPANDALIEAGIIGEDLSSIRGTNRFATREKAESDHILSGSSVGQSSVWYRWTAWTSGPIKADVCRSNFDTVLAVYTRNDKGKMEKVADDDDGCSVRNQRGSSVVFEAELEETYWIAVSGYSKASTGFFELRLSPAPPPEAAE